MAKFIDLPIEQLSTGTNSDLPEELKLQWLKVVFRKDFQSNIAAIRFYFELPLHINQDLSKEHLSPISIPLDNYEESVHMLCDQFFTNPVTWYSTTDTFIKKNKFRLSYAAKKLKQRESISLESSELSCLYDDGNLTLCFAELGLFPVSAVEKEKALILVIRRDSTLEDIKQIYKTHIESAKTKLLSSPEASLPLTESLEVVNDIVALREPLIGNVVPFKEIASIIQQKYPGKPFDYNDANNAYKRGRKWGF